MRTDDPVILQQIQQLENVADSLRRICGFPPRLELPETRANREPRWCPHCHHGADSRLDLAHHIASEHAKEAA